MLTHPNVKHDLIYHDLIYLAQAYTHVDPKVRQDRYEYACGAVAYYALKNIPVFSPIVHWHEVSKRFNLPHDIDFWETQCLSTLSRCTRLHLLQRDNWQASNGVFVELKHALSLSIPVYVITCFNDFANPKLVHTPSIIKKMNSHGKDNSERGPYRDYLKPVDD